MSEVSQEWLEHLFIFLVQNKNSPKVLFAETFPEAFLPIPELTLHSISVVQITSIKGGGRGESVFNRRLSALNNNITR